MPDLKLQHELLPSGVCFIQAEGFLDAHTFEQMDQEITSVKEMVKRF